MSVWELMTNPDGTPRTGPPGATYGVGSTLENSGDAIEALEACYGMIWLLAERVAYRDMDPQTRTAVGTAPREAIMRHIAAVADTYHAGVLLGRGSR
jgi:hypothetical protein